PRHSVPTRICQELRVHGVLSECILRSPSVCTIFGHHFPLGHTPQTVPADPCVRSTRPPLPSYVRFPLSQRLHSSVITSSNTGRALHSRWGRVEGVGYGSEPQTSAVLFAPCRRDSRARCGERLVYRTVQGQRGVYPSKCVHSDMGP